jgi:menaquinol-cytochrome c reductase iron-sulfur subunit
MKSERSSLEAVENATPTGHPVTPDESAKAGTRWPRRKILTRLGLGATVTALSGLTYACIRALVPNVLYEAPRQFKVGTPDQFNEGARFLEDKRVFIVRQANTFQALSAVCTHLGCTVKMQRLNQPKKVSVLGREIEEAREFHCPCHGSKYYGDGTNYAGPAPRPLSYFRIDVSPEDGQLVVDASKTVDRDYKLTV